MAMGVAPKAAPVSLLVLVVAACGDDDGSSPASAPQGLCSSLQSGRTRSTHRTAHRPPDGARCVPSGTR